MRQLVVVIGLTCLTSVAAAQNEAALRAAFEGKAVTVRIDMPGTSKGVDIFPMNQTPLDVRELAERLKEYGTALKPGQTVMVTKVVIKGNTHIEFQLGGGGFGTFGDDMGSTVHAPDQGETRAERALKDSIKASGCCPTKRKQFEKELASKRAERERENAAAEAQAQQANQAREANLRLKRMESGSRFNIRYREGLTSAAITPDGVRKALAEYVDFPGTTAAAAPAAAAAPSASSASALTSLKKGLSIKEVEAVLGPAVTAGEQKEGTLLVLKRTYRKDGMLVTARFVNDVMIDFAITPQ